MFQQIKRGGQICHQLPALRKDDMMWRQHGQSPSAGAAARHQHRAGLRDERITFGNAGIAPLKLVNVIIFVRETNGQAKCVYN